MKWGIYRVSLPERGECARVHWLAGDAAPYLERSHYEAAKFTPPFHELPSGDEYRARHGISGDARLLALEQGRQASI